MALKAREREIDIRSQALERERDRIHALNAAGVGASGKASAVRQHNQHSYSMTNLAVPRTSANTMDPTPTRPVTQYGDPAALALSASQSTSSSDSAGARPRTHSGTGNVNNAGQFSHVQVVPTPRQQKEKAKSGWMRRLSMPAVSAAFSSDTKKTPGPGYGVGAGIGGGPGTAPGYGYSAGVQGFERDATGGISNVLARPRKLSLGKR